MTMIEAGHLLIKFPDSCNSLNITDKASFLFRVLVQFPENEYQFNIALQNAQYWYLNYVLKCEYNLSVQRKINELNNRIKY